MSSTPSQPLFLASLTSLLAERRSRLALHCRITLGFGPGVVRAQRRILPLRHQSDPRERAICASLARLYRL